MRKTIKNIIKNSSLFEIYLLIRKFLFSFKKNKKIKYFREEGEEMLQKLSLALNEHEIIFWLEFGTLLGYYRENDFIKDDFDIDIGAFLSDAPKVRKALLKSGFELAREFRCLKNDGREECYSYKHSTFDIFYFREENGVRYCNGFSHKEGVSWKPMKHCPCTVRKITFPLVDFSEVTFKGAKVYIPQKTNEYLQCHYGKDFMTPDPNFSSRKVSTNVYYYSYEENPAEVFLKM